MCRRQADNPTTNDYNSFAHLSNRICSSKLLAAYHQKCFAVSGLEMGKEIPGDRSRRGCYEKPGYGKLEKRPAGEFSQPSAATERKSTDLLVAFLGHRH